MQVIVPSASRGSVFFRIRPGAMSTGWVTGSRWHGSQMEEMSFRKFINR
jgi:hypothetical protein